MRTSHPHPPKKKKIIIIIQTSAACSTVAVFMDAFKCRNVSFLTYKNRKSQRNNVLFLVWRVMKWR